MDCEKLDQHVIDALYGELDELTQAALERHAEGCSRCGPIYAGLKATRAVAVLPLEEPPADLEARILAAADLQIAMPRRGRLSRAMAWTRQRALGPQLAAAAVFALVIGSSLALFQAKSPSRARSAAADISAESAPAATAAAQAAPPAPPPSPVVASERSAESRNLEGDLPAAPASAAATAVAALPVAAATASAAQPRAAGGQVAAIEAEKASPPAAKAAAKPPAAKPRPSFGGPNPRAPAAPMYNDALK